MQTGLLGLKKEDRFLLKFPGKVSCFRRTLQKNQNHVLLAKDLWDPLRQPAGLDCYYP